jgi:hypothetical protein
MGKPLHFIRYRAGMEDAAVREVLDVYQRIIEIKRGDPKRS